MGHLRCLLWLAAALLPAAAAAAEAQTCKDSHEKCQRWASLGECEKNPAWMHPHCAVSCKTCDARLSVDPRCQDQLPDCAALASRGGCSRNVSTMSEFCPRSCSVCGPGDVCIANATDEGAFPTHEVGSWFSALINSPEAQRYGLEVISTDPYLVVLKNFLSQEEIDDMVNQFSDGWQRSLAGGVTGADVVKPGRTSENQWCYSDCEQKSSMRHLLERVEKVTNISNRRYENAQILRYQQGQRYGSHSDFIPAQNQLAHGPRVLTFFIYLTDTPGASTRFRHLNYSVPSLKGQAAIWSSVMAHDIWQEEVRTSHEALPPDNGATKFAINVWIHQYSFKDFNVGDCLKADRKLRYIEASRGGEEL
mmetsp:Transcript_21895/g.48383  ORF Transcript_21895/g.48383 Transcript_21895/m.48383 type:complete len:364 (-) Transcript_21895:118-1209(-)